MLNSAGQLDALAARSVDGRPVQISMGAVRRDQNGRSQFRLDEAGLLVSTFADSWVSFGAELTLKLRDRVADLDVPLQRQVYAGTGGAAGGEALKDRTKPMMIGRCFGHEPAFLDLGIWQLSSGKIHSVSAVRFGGVLVTGQIVEVEGGFEALASTSAPPGGYAITRHASGSYIKLGDLPAAVVTVDGRGETLDRATAYAYEMDGFARMDGFMPWVETIEGPGYVETIGGITRMLLDRSLNWGLTEMSLDSFNALDREQKAPMGASIPLGSTITLGEFLSDFLGTAGCYMDIGRLGEVRLNRMRAPDSTAAFRLTEQQITRLDREPLPYGIPADSVTVEYHRNGRPLTSSDIAPAVPVGDREALQAVALSAAATDPTIKMHHRRAQARTVGAYFALENDARSEASRQLSVYDETRRQFKISVPFYAERYELGRTVEIKHPSHGLGAGRRFSIVRIEADFARSATDLTVFG